MGRKSYPNAVRDTEIVRLRADGIDTRIIAEEFARQQRKLKALDQLIADHKAKAEQGRHTP